MRAGLSPYGTRRARPARVLRRRPRADRRDADGGGDDRSSAASARRGCPRSRTTASFATGCWPTSGSGLQVISPRPSDPYRLHAYFVSPSRRFGPAALPAVRQLRRLGTALDQRQLRERRRSAGGPRDGGRVDGALPDPPDLGRAGARRLRLRRSGLRRARALPGQPLEPARSGSEIDLGRARRSARCPTR